jgi:hypothetical protein
MKEIMRDVRADFGAEPREFNGNPITSIRW